MIYPKSGIMATLGNALMGALLGHSDAEKMFRLVINSMEEKKP
jgi:hypothetical protein